MRLIDALAGNLEVFRLDFHPNEFPSEIHAGDSPYIIQSSEGWGARTYLQLWSPDPSDTARIDTSVYTISGVEYCVSLMTGGQIDYARLYVLTESGSIVFAGGWGYDGPWPSSKSVSYSFIAASDTTIIRITDSGPNGPLAIDDIKMHRCDGSEAITSATLVIEANGEQRGFGPYSSAGAALAAYDTWRTGQITSFAA